MSTFELSPYEKHLVEQGELLHAAVVAGRRMGESGKISSFEQSETIVKVLQEYHVQCTNEAQRHQEAKVAEKAKEIQLTEEEIDMVKRGLVINAIKAVHDRTGVGLASSKAAVDPYRTDAAVLVRQR